MNLDSHGAIAFIMGGLGFFMFGMSFASDCLQRLGANRIRKLFNRIGGRQYLAILIGIGMTVFLQSSGVVTSMLVGLGSAEVCTLQQVMGIIVGTAVGSTLTVQIISFNFAEYGLPIFAISYIFYFGAKKRTIKDLLGICVGFGMLFCGIEMMSDGTAALKNYKIVTEAFTELSQNPFTALIVTSLFTAIVHSSAVTIGLAMSLTNAGIISFYDALFWVYGANIGTTATALHASVGTNYIGKQVAWAHFFYKIGAVCLFYFFTEKISQEFLLFDTNTTRNIANAHTLLNIVSAIVFYPLITPAANMIQKLFPKSADEKNFQTEFINLENYQSVELAYAQARREALRMGDIVLGMLKDSIELFKAEDPELIDSIKKRDTQVDILQKEIKLFLAQMSDKSGDLGKTIIRLITYISDLEHAGDVIDNGILVLAKKKQALKLEFSPEGWKEIREMHSKVVETVSVSLSCFHLQDKELANRVIQMKRNLRKFELQLKEYHIERLNKGLIESINTSSIHLDLLSDFRRIVGLLTNHAYTIADKTE